MSSFIVFKQRSLSYRISSMALCYCRCGADLLHTVSQLELYWPTVGETVKRTFAGYGTAKLQDLEKCWCVHILCCFKNRHCAQAMNLS